MIEILKYLMPAILASGATALLLVYRFRLRPKSVKLPFVDFDVSNFSTLTAVQFFNHVTAIRLPAAPATTNPHKPIILVHAGWMMVSDAFIQKMGHYPSETNVQAAAAALGIQNAEFINAAREIYEAAIREGDRLEQSFAESFVMRCPALAQRISGDATLLEVFAVKQYRRWEVS